MGRLLRKLLNCSAVCPGSVLVGLEFLVCLVPFIDAFAQTDIAKREEYLRKLIPLLSLELDDAGTADPRISHDYQNWREWIDKTGELPPDFASMPSHADLPDPLVLERDGREIPIATLRQWDAKRAWMKQQLQHWIYGTMPPPPNNLQARVISERTDGRTTIRLVELTFGPHHGARLRMELIIPPGDGPFPVFMTQWNHRGWALIAVQRGYLACVYAGADARDDTFDYQTIYPDYDFTVLARRAWGAHRCVDYLLSLAIVDGDRIALAGHSRNGKQSLIAAAFDERIKAVITSSAGSGGEMPARYDRDNFYAGDMVTHVTNRRSWFHPRWRFFVGRQNKLPIDSNSLIALIAPNACMISTALNETEANNWAQEQVFQSARRVWAFLGVEDRLALRFRGGGHAAAARDIEDYFDFFDTVFDRGRYPVPRMLNHDYSFMRWRHTTTLRVDASEYPEKDIDDLLDAGDGARISASDQWQRIVPAIQDRIRWSFGRQPPRATNPGPLTVEVARTTGRREDNIASTIGRPSPTPTMGKLTIAPYHSFGNYLQGDVYYPRARDRDTPVRKLPVIIWLHPYSYNAGYGSEARSRGPFQPLTARGYAVFGFDQIGFGTRVEEGRNFYQRYPDWSLMGRMVADVRAAVDALSNLDMVDSERIYCLGYSMGATVGLFAAALDDRIKGMVSVCGFSPFRRSTPEKEQAHAIIRKYSHLHGLLPLLGCFLDSPTRIPYDFHEILGLIAPRPLMVVAPELDWDNYQPDVLDTVEEVRKVYRLFGAEEKIKLLATYNTNRWTTRMNPLSPQREVFEWISQEFK